MKKIELTKGYVALVDDEDYDKLMSYGSWYASVGGRTAYASVKKQINYKRVTYKMHRIIMGVPEHLMVDHINHNGCDNRKENLRICTQRENTMNITMLSNNKSGVRGVSYSKTANKWHSIIRVCGERIHLGWWSDFEDAVSARKEAEKKYGYFFGEHKKGLK